jgi:hypothetical protein
MIYDVIRVHFVGCSSNISIFIIRKYLQWIEFLVIFSMISSGLTMKDFENSSNKF